MMNKLFPIQIHRRDDHFVATTALEKLASDPDRINAQLRDLADSYTRAITTAREALAEAKRNPSARAEAYWRAGQAILIFEKALNEIGFYLPAQNATCARDLGMAEGTFRRFIAFRRRNPNPNALDADDPWRPPRQRDLKREQ